MTFQPPADWKVLYDKLRAYRRRVLVAPVDTVGCDRLHDANVPHETQRFHTLVALMLSAQTRDQVTAEAMTALKQHGLTPQSIAAMSSDQLDACIRKVSFHNTKTRHIKQVADILLQQYNDHVPRELDELLALPGVGPKMAHLFLQGADQRVLGIGVDTHVHRISQRFGWVPSTVRAPEDTRKALESWLPRRHWAEINELLVGLGQTVCAPVRPRCGECALAGVCPNAFREPTAKVRLDKKSTTTTSTLTAKGDAKSATATTDARKRGRSSGGSSNNNSNDKNKKSSSKSNIVTTTTTTRAMRGTKGKPACDDAVVQTTTPRATRSARASVKARTRLVDLEDLALTHSRTTSRKTCV